MNDLFCVDCRHSQDTGRGEYGHICNSPFNVVEHVATEKYLVSGKVQPVIKAIRGASCTALRISRSPEIDETVCGPDAKWFEAKE